ncbi:hypothetical protein B2A_09532, partial [mine drainage metagenome]
MSETIPKLRNPPIMEAVLDIECDLPPSADLGALEAPASKAFSEQYPTLQRRLWRELRMEAKTDGALNSSVQHGLQALLFTDSTGKQLVQVRKSGYSFNRLAPYEGLNTYLSEIQRTWDLYREIASPIVVRSLRLRYINKIRIPVAAAPVELDKYLRLQQMLADDQRLTLTGFLNQYSAIENETRHQVAVMLTAQPQEADKLPVIFDNAAAASVEIKPDDWKRISTTLLELRVLKNLVFRKTLTDS